MRAALVALSLLVVAVQPVAALPPLASSPAPGNALMAVSEPLDINRATDAQLQELKGIGPARAKAIIAGRPFRSKDELLERKIVPQNVYNDIKDKIIARQR
jgi:DNA uptake protein ComE-like DNA-binding protein